jgi:predicted TIM-barrel fold metal-dependent hydrolase
VVLGTHAPLYYPHAGVAKVNDAPLPEDQVAAIKEGNARRLLGLGKR